MTLDAQQIQLQFPGTRRDFEQSFVQLRQALDGWSLRRAARYHVELIFEEIVANILRHGAPDGRELGIGLSLAVSSGAIVMTFDDDGIAFDPCSHPDPVAPATLLEAPDGGLGLKMVHRTAIAMRYERTPEQRNRLVVALDASV